MILLGRVTKQEAKTLGKEAVENMGHSIKQALASVLGHSIWSDATQLEHLCCLFNAFQGNLLARYCGEGPEV